MARKLVIIGNGIASARMLEHLFAAAPGAYGSRSSTPSRALTTIGSCFRWYCPARNFGSDSVPGAYEDFELADLVVLVGSNLARCHPDLFQRLIVVKEKHGTTLVVIDPRRTATAEMADLHLANRPGERRIIV